MSSQIILGQLFEVVQPEHFSVSLTQPCEQLSDEQQPLDPVNFAVACCNIRKGQGRRFGRVDFTRPRPPVVAAQVANRADQPSPRIFDARVALNVQQHSLLAEAICLVSRNSELSRSDEHEDGRQLTIETFHRLRGCHAVSARARRGCLVQSFQFAAFSGSRSKISSIRTGFEESFLHAPRIRTMCFRRMSVSSSRQRPTVWRLNPDSRSRLADEIPFASSHCCSSVLGRGDVGTSIAVLLFRESTRNRPDVRNVNGTGISESKLLYFRASGGGQIVAPLESLALIIRSARNAAHLTQHGAAKLAGVSRRQWALLEQGGNVSVVFLLKVTRSLGLELSVVPRADSAASSGASGNLDVLQLLRMSEDLVAFSDHLRSFAIDAAVPPSVHGDAAAVDAFVAAHEHLTADAAGRLDVTLGRVASDVLRRTPSLPRAESLPRKTRRRRES